MGDKGGKKDKNKSDKQKKSKEAQKAKKSKISNRKGFRERNPDPSKNGHNNLGLVQGQTSIYNNLYVVISN